MTVKEKNSLPSYHKPPKSASFDNCATCFKTFRKTSVSEKTIFFSFTFFQLWKQVFLSLFFNISSHLGDFDVGEKFQGAFKLVLIFVCLFNC